MTAQPPQALPWVLGDAFGPRPRGGPDVIAELARSGLQGRGGARFPAARKWEAVAQRARGRAAVLVNAAEGEPLSRKDGVLLWNRLHLVLDGALIAAESLGADEIVLYVRSDYLHALTGSGALARTLADRPRTDRLGSRLRVVSAPAGYVAGEETSAVQAANGGPAKPTFTPPRPFESGVGGRPTLVQNPETLAYAALIARFGAEWFRSVGSECSPGAALFTVGGAVARPGVYEQPHGIRLEDLLRLAGGSATDGAGVLTGGYFGRWLSPAAAAEARLDDDSLAAAGGRIGCGSIFVLPAGSCGLAATASVLEYLAREGAQQCGPCRYGVRALAEVVRRIASGSGTVADHVSIDRWSEQLATGRGACRLPDGAVAMLQSALKAFARDLAQHKQRRRCEAVAPAGLPAA